MSIFPPFMQIYTEKTGEFSGIFAVVKFFVLRRLLDGISFFFCLALNAASTKKQDSSSCLFYVFNTFHLSPFTFHL